MDPVLPAGLPRTDPGRRPRRTFPLWLTWLLVAAWLLSVWHSLRTVRDEPLSPWALWRLSDQDLRHANNETLPAAILRRAEMLEKDPEPRSRAGAAILWHLAENPEKARAIPLGPAEEPFRDDLVRALLDGGNADQATLESWVWRIEAGESYWWEERLILELTADGDELHLAAAGLSERRQQQLFLAGWVNWIPILLLMVAGLMVAVRIFRRCRPGSRLDRVPPFFHWIGWRRVMAGVATAELGALLLLLVASAALAFQVEWTRVQLALRDTMWRGASTAILCLAFFPGLRVAMRAVRLDLRFTIGPVVAALGISLAVGALCQWLLPEDPEQSQVVLLNPWTFGGTGLAFTLWSGCLVAPLFEEIVHRGFIFNSLASRFGTVAGVVVSSAIFSAIHGYPLSGSISIFCFGVISALLYRATGSLGASVLLHSAFNFTSVIGYWLTLESPYF